MKGIPKEELIICIPLLYSHLEDRSSDLRKNSQEAVLGVMIHVGYEAMLKQCEKLKVNNLSSAGSRSERVFAARVATRRHRYVREC